jgi:CelD/BcsL family acetyltransferase involved in cellulose biosynthesis
VRFFEEMTRGFSERGKALFCELLLDGKVIASSSNYVSGSCVLAFKIGWDPDFARFSPGRLAELAIIEHLSAELPEVDRLDSGSAPGSYVERMWLERHYLSEGMIATSRAAGAALSLLNLMRQLRRRVRGLVAKGRGG